MPLDQWHGAKMVIQTLMGEILLFVPRIWFRFFRFNHRKFTAIEIQGDLAAIPARDAVSLRAHVTVPQAPANSGHRKCRQSAKQSRSPCKVGPLELFRTIFGPSPVHNILISVLCARTESLFLSAMPKTLCTGDDERGPWEAMIVRTVTLFICPYTVLWTLILTT